jgi:hypothetical protein
VIVLENNATSHASGIMDVVYKLWLQYHVFLDYEFYISLCRILL